MVAHHCLGEWEIKWKHKSQPPRAELQVKAQLSTVEGMPCHVAACDDHELKKNNEMMNIVWCVL